MHSIVKRRGQDRHREWTPAPARSRPGRALAAPLLVGLAMWGVSSAATAEDAAPPAESWAICTLDGLRVTTATGGS